MSFMVFSNERKPMTTPAIAPRRNTGHPELVTCQVCKLHLPSTYRDSRLRAGRLTDFQSFKGAKREFVFRLMQRIEMQSQLDSLAQTLNFPKLNNPGLKQSGLS
jgi:hypothetical protein